VVKIVKFLKHQKYCGASGSVFVHCTVFTKHFWFPGLLRPEDHWRGHGLAEELAAMKPPPREEIVAPETPKPSISTPAQRWLFPVVFIFSRPLRRLLYAAPPIRRADEAECIAPSHHLRVLMRQAAFLHSTAGRKVPCASPRRHLPERAHVPRQRFAEAMRKHSQVCCAEGQPL
jgi:hypothetical protein